MKVLNNWIEYCNDVDLISTEELLKRLKELNVNMSLSCLRCYINLGLISKSIRQGKKAYYESKEIENILIIKLLVHTHKFRVKDLVEIKKRKKLGKVLVEVESEG